MDMSDKCKHLDSLRQHRWNSPRTFDKARSECAVLLRPQTGSHAGPSQDDERRTSSTSSPHHYRWRGIVKNRRRFSTTSLCLALCFPMLVSCLWVPNVNPGELLSTCTLSESSHCPFANTTQPEQHRLPSIHYGSGTCALGDVADVVPEVVPGLRASRLARLLRRGAPTGRRATADDRSSTHRPTGCAKIPTLLIFRFPDLVSPRFSHWGFS